MGNCFVSKENGETYSLTKTDFNFFEVIGSGMYGKVWKASIKETSGMCAIKVIEKSLIASEASINSILNERSILTSLRHPLLVNLQFAFQDRNNLYLAIDLKPGGDLRYHLLVQSRFTEEQCKFFACCLILAIDYIHSKGILHRDIKPENLIFDSSGFLHLSDFGSSCMLKKDNTCTEISGTPGYMAPEALFRKPHGFASDYYGLGAVLHEALLGKRHFAGFSCKDIMNEVMEQNSYVSTSSDDISTESADFLNGLLMKNCKERLGANGIEEVKAHPWLENVNWSDFENKSIEPPFKPILADNFSIFSHFNCGYKRKKERNLNLDSRFIGYFYVSPYIQGLNY